MMLWPEAAQFASQPLQFFNLDSPSVADFSLTTRRTRENVLKVTTRARSLNAYWTFPSPAVQRHSSAHSRPQPAAR
jgi:hypothetical protein